MRPSKQIKGTLLATLLLAVFFAGCGQTGPPFHPAVPQVTTPVLQHAVVSQRYSPTLAERAVCRRRASRRTNINPQNSPLSDPRLRNGPLIRIFSRYLCRTLGDFPRSPLLTP